MMVSNYYQDFAVCREKEIQKLLEEKSRLDASGYSLYAQRQGIPVNGTWYEELKRYSQPTPYIRFYEGITMFTGIDKAKGDGNLDDDFFRVELPRLNQEN